MRERAGELHGPGNLGRAWLSMPRMRCPALAVAVLAAGFAPAAGCAPTGASDPTTMVVELLPEPAAKPPVPPRARPTDRVRPLRRAGPRLGCGRIALLPAGPWERDERLATVRDGWSPRAEHGRPVAIRTAIEPFSLPDHQLLQVKVEHSPREIQPCWLRLTPHVEGDDWLDHGCARAEEILPWVPSQARPRRARQWAELLGTFDDASAVLSSEHELDRCVEGLPPAVRAEVPPLGVRRAGGEQHVVFVEWIEEDDLILLLAVTAVIADARLDIDRHELMMIDAREGGR